MPSFRKFGFGIALAAGLACVPFGIANAAAGRLTVDSGGMKRSAYVVEHARLKRTLRPTIIVLHGQSGTGMRVRKYLGLEDTLKSQSVVTVYPDAIDGHWNVSDASERDVRFIRDLVHKLVSDGIADRRRVFLVGSATGGILAMRLACQDAHAFAGVAALIALMPAAEASACKPMKPLPFLLLAGTADPRVPFAGGKADLVEYKGDVASAEATVAPFAAAAGCNGGQAKADLPDRDPNDGSRVQVDRWQGCKAPVELVKVEGGGHTLPGRPRITDRGLTVGAHNNDVNTTHLILDFFRRASGG
ncbi:MAG: phospholipase [Hyphomicrobiales bacterium]|nr:phospholipase [Hyphomicrobiales bacterium]